MTLSIVDRDILNKLDELQRASMGTLKRVISHSHSDIEAGIETLVTNGLIEDCHVGWTRGGKSMREYTFRGKATLKAASEWKIRELESKLNEERTRLELINSI